MQSKVSEITFRVCIFLGYLWQEMKYSIEIDKTKSSEKIYLILRTITKPAWNYRSQSLSRINENKQIEETIRRLEFLLRKMKLLLPEQDNVRNGVRNEIKFHAKCIYSCRIHVCHQLTIVHGRLTDMLTEK